MVCLCVFLCVLCVFLWVFVCFCVYILDCGTFRKEPSAIYATFFGLYFLIIKTGGSAFFSVAFFPALFFHGLLFRDSSPRWVSIHLATVPRTFGEAFCLSQFCRSFSRRRNAIAVVNATPRLRRSCEFVRDASRCSASRCSIRFRAHFSELRVRETSRLPVACRIGRSASKSSLPAGFRPKAPSSSPRLRPAEDSRISESFPDSVGLFANSPAAECNGRQNPAAEEAKKRRVRF